MSALQQHKLFVFYLKWEGAMDRLTLSSIVVSGSTLPNRGPNQRLCQGKLVFDFHY